MKKVILNALAVAENAGVSTQVKDVANVADVYIKNAFVSLTSCKIKNPDADVCLIVNQALNDEYAQLFSKQNITIHIIPFDAYAIPNTFMWQLAFFKLFALQYAVNEMVYDQYILMDSDTYCTKNMDEFWKEIEPGAIHLYHLHSAYSERTRKEIIDGFEIMYGRKASITNWGGEFIAGNRADLQMFSKLSMTVYQDMMNNLNQLSTNIGDEFVTSIAAYLYDKKIVVANAYITRFMTGRMYSCITNYAAVALWHMPVEKSYTMLKLYRYYQSHHCFPKDEQVAVWAGLPNNKRTHSLPYFVYRLQQKIVKKVTQNFRKS